MHSLQLSASSLRAMIDDVDLDALHTVQFRSGPPWSGRVCEVKWYSHVELHNTYVLCNAGRRAIRLHRLILDAERGQIVDHIDGNGLNNQRANLRIASPSVNAINRRKTKVLSSRFKGVCKTTQSPHGKYAAYISINYRKTHLGYFTDEIDAALAYNIAATDAWGADAVLNEIPELATT